MYHDINKHLNEMMMTMLYPGSDLSQFDSVLELYTLRCSSKHTNTLHVLRRTTLGPPNAGPGCTRSTRRVYIL
jgi:hypothetical protein